MKKVNALAVIVCVMAVVNVTSADTIQGIDINFVTIGNPGNAGDTRAEANPNGCGAVSYNYRIGKYEVTNAQWNAFTAAAGAPTGNPSYAYDENAYWTGAQQPTNYVSWYEAAQFCNYLTSGNKSLGAYQLGTDGSITVNRAAAISAYDTAYVIPTEDEWYKAAYFKPDGSGYSLYANGQNTIPAADGWNYYGGSSIFPWNVGTGEQEQNGTFDMMGNVCEWNETLIDGFYRGIRGWSYDSGGADPTGYYLSSSGRNDCLRDPTFENDSVGFRIASVPEPATLLLFALGAFVLKRKLN
jgi:formylglycine-generating enzyme